jgi:hypothetical protein
VKLLENRWLRTGHRPVLALRRPSPAMIVALIALFASLGGVSYAFATGEIDTREIKNNDVRSLDVRNNEIRTRDLRNNEVRGIDIRNSTIQGRDVQLNTITGDDVREDTLQKVPTALLADSATRATSADSADDVSTLKAIPPTVVAEGGPEATLATHGPLKLLAQCGQTAGNTVAHLLVSTTENHSAVGDESVVEPDFGTVSSPYEVSTQADPPAGTRSVKLVQLFASAPSGKAFTGQMVLYADGAGAGSCTFHGALGLQG